MRCDRCDKPMAPDESVPYTVPGATGPGATGPGVTIRVHRIVCKIPPTHTRSYPAR